MSAADAITGATAVITHHVAHGQEESYNAWIEEIRPLSQRYPGLLDWQVVRPIPGITNTYTVIIRFDTLPHLQAWMQSPERLAMIDKVRPLLAHDDQYQIGSGFDFWFPPAGTPPKAPVRWKQFLITWSAIYPLAIGVPLLVIPLLRGLGVPKTVWLDPLCVTATIVSLMVYVVMPRYTRLVHRWLQR